MIEYNKKRYLNLYIWARDSWWISLLISIWNTWGYLENSMCIWPFQISLLIITRFPMNFFNLLQELVVFDLDLDKKSIYDTIIKRLRCLIERLGGKRSQQKMFFFYYDQKRERQPKSCNALSNISISSQFIANSLLQLINCHQFQGLNKVLALCFRNLDDHC